MNLKSYFRGIGAGMIVTALIMGVSLPVKTDAEQIQKETLKDTQTSASMIVTSVENPFKEEPSPVIEPEPENKNDENAEPVEDANKQDETEPAKEPETEPVTETEADPGTEPETEPGTDTGAEPEVTPPEEVTPPPINPLEKGDTGYTATEESVSIKIVKGDNSVSVSRRMYEAGLVESAVEFDKYLCKNKYDKKISVGTFDIKFGLTFEQMAKIITRTKSK